MYEREVHQLRDLAYEDNMVIMPDPNRVHGFQESRTDRRCRLCSRKRASVFHTYGTGGRDWPRAGQAARRG